MSRFRAGTQVQAFGRRAERIGQTTDRYVRVEDYVIPSREKTMPTRSGIREVKLHRFRADGCRVEPDLVTIEEPLDIRLPDGAAWRTVAITMRTPGADVDLAVGFLFSEGILTDWGQVEDVAVGAADEARSRNTVSIRLRAGETVDWGRLARNSYVSSSCGVCGKTSLEQVRTVLPFGGAPARWRVAAHLIPSLPARLRRAQSLFAQTGSIHAAGLCDLRGELLRVAEDVGRHNALDKLIGGCFQAQELPLERHLLVLSGRASFELVQKAAMAGINFVVAVGAPSSLAVELAGDLGMTLCGFVRAGGFNCYAGERRIATR